MAEIGEYADFISKIKIDNFEEVKRIFKSEYITMSDKDGMTALHWATIYDSIIIVRYLLDNGWDIEYETGTQHRAVHFAVLNGYLPILNELIHRGCLLEVRTKDGLCPLDLAVKYNYEDCADELWTAMRMNRTSEPCFVNFEKEYIIGHGKFGRVYKCLDKKSKRHFAMMKISRRSRESIEEDMRIIEENMPILKKCSRHPRLVRYYGMMRREEKMYLFTEYIAAGSIKDLLTWHGPLALNDIARYTKQILEGLQFLHQNNIIHLGICGLSIMRDANDNVKLKGFGLMTYLRRPSAEGVTGQFPYMISGTPYFMAPEIICCEMYSTPADVWSLGATVLEMLTGNPPYHNLNMYAAMIKVAMKKTIEYESSQPIVEELKYMLDGMFQPEPSKRENIKSLLKSEFIIQYAKQIDRGRMNEVSGNMTKEDQTSKQVSGMNREEQLFIGFTREEVLGQGAFGKVYKSYDKKLKRDVAIKEIWLGLNESINVNAQSIEHEITIYKKLPIHPTITEYYGTYQDRDMMYIIMEYVTGGSVKDELKRGTLAPNIISRYVKQILQGLAVLHENGIIHRDIKASNILKDGNGNLKLCDFGISRECASYTTNSRTTSGTAHWMAPEVIRSQGYDTSADLWSLGITVLEMLTGNPPYHDLPDCAAIFKIGNMTKVDYQPPVPIHADLQEFLDTLLQCEPKDRATIETLLNSQFICSHN